MLVSIKSGSGSDPLMIFIVASPDSSRSLMSFLSELCSSVDGGSGGGGVRAVGEGGAGSEGGGGTGLEGGGSSGGGGAGFVT